MKKKATTTTTGLSKREAVKKFKDMKNEDLNDLRIAQKTERFLWAALAQERIEIYNIALSIINKITRI